MRTREVALYVRTRGELLVSDPGEGPVRPPTVSAGDGAPREAARRWLRSETPLSPADIVRVGDPVRGDGAVLHPVLVDGNRREWGEEWTRLGPQALPEVAAVPWLWDAYDSVRPTVSTVAADTEHGAGTLSRRALEVLRDEAVRLLVAGDEPASASEVLRDRARALQEARPSMAVVANRLNRVMATTDHTDPAAVAAAAHRESSRATAADEGAASTAAERVAGARVATLSCSSTVLGALEQGSPSAVLVAESRPGGEGVDVAERLARECPVTLATDAAFPTRLSSWDADLLLVGADTVGPDGRVRNKVGTAPAAVVAGRAGVRVVVAAATDKVTPCLSHGDDPWPTALYDGDAPLATANPTFDVTPADAIETIATDRGPLALDDVAAVAAEHDRRADWPR